MHLTPPTMQDPVIDQFDVTGNGAHLTIPGQPAETATGGLHTSIMILEAGHMLEMLTGPEDGLTIVFSEEL